MPVNEAITSSTTLRFARPISSLILCFLIWLAPWASTVLALTIDPELERQTIDSDIEMVVTSAKTTVADVLRRRDAEWQPVKSEINSGYKDAVHWFRLELENPKSVAIKRLLEIGYPLLDHLTLYEIVDGRVTQRTETGDRQPFHRRPIQDRHFLFPVTLPADGDLTILLRVQTSGSLQVPLTLWQERAFHADSEAGSNLRASLYGILLVMCAFNLFLFASLRKKAYLYYVLVVFSTLVLMSSLHGFAFQYVYPDSPRLHELVILLIVPLCQILFCLFTMEFLDLKRHQPQVNRLFQILISLAILCLLGAFVLPYEISTRLSVILSLPVAAANLMAGLWLWYHHKRSARLFSLAWMSLLAGLILAVLNRVGALPANFLTVNSISLGASLQALLFSFALADRFNREREARFQAQQSTLEAVQSQRRAEQRLFHAASHHELTGLPNRLLFEDRVQARLGNLPEGHEMVIVLLHLRRADEVNKTLGYRNADQLLQKVAIRLNQVVGDCPNAVPLRTSEQTALNCAAYVEGVTFACALSGQEPDELLSQATSIAEQMAQPIDFMGLSMDLSFTVGCSFTENGNGHIHMLLRQAFIAFDQASHHSGTVAVYKPEMNPYSERRLTLMTELRSAIENDKLRLYFQPQLNPQTQRVKGFEALLRWSHPEYGIIPPDEFIPMAEQTGLIKPLTRWVISNALSFCHQLNHVDPTITVAVNISAVNLREPGFSEQAKDLLSSSQVDARNLVMEVTETEAMTDPKSAIQTLRALKEAQIGLSIDDFGTGHSSLSYIRKLPIGEIKIDRSFVTGMDENDGDSTIVRTTVNMCHDLGYEVVAEGVETAEVQSMLAAMNCDRVQGYHIAPPMDADQAITWLVDRPAFL
ncbi:diguanylate cyclase/phosphodiesterase [Tamilnaduibacter salinus]|uniref:Diguanylate cyclase/phosphodiesterase n=1 Tax=Tamilnaduibacter salinus TaxID=1484056 RepID=A0A2U1D1H1_9GAMM|nr:EAL domain-containing protein [Tamilnaduibacter salinus]PVY79121.1 diguanylate cyclase/phosphodiesterase [Tamilnaduibacter salinus]